MDATARRMIAALLVFMAIGVVVSIWQGDSLGTTLGYVLTGVIAGGFVIGCYIWARRKN